MNILHRTRRGFTLLEVVVSVAVGSIVVGAAMMLYFQGNKYFYRTTEHSSFRSEALVLLERIGQDLEALQVSTGQKTTGPNAGKFFMTHPYDLIGGGTMPLPIEGGGTEQVPFGRELVFQRFHHIEAGPPTAVLASGAPRMVSRKLRFYTQPIDGDAAANGVDLYRNDEKINQIPLQEVLFHQEPKRVFAGQVQGTQAAVLTISIVPKGGVFGNMDIETLNRMQEQGHIVSRTFHLSGYESFYTTILYAAIQRRHAGSSMLTGATALEDAVYDDARTNNPDGFSGIVSTVSGGAAPVTHLVPADCFVQEETRNYSDSDSNADPSWMSLTSTYGNAAASGEWDFEPKPGSKSSSSSG